jgi:hypothetical protein
MTSIQIADLVPLAMIAATFVGVAGAGIRALGVYTHNQRLQTIGDGINSAALLIHRDMQALAPGVDVNAFKDAKVAQWVGALTERNAGLIAKTGMPASLVAEKIESAIHQLNVSSPTTAISSGMALGQAIETHLAPLAALAPVVETAESMAAKSGLIGPSTMTTTVGTVADAAVRATGRIGPSVSGT